MHTPKTPQGGRHSSWGMSLLCSPLCQLKIKAIFVFTPNSVSIFYSAFSGQRGPRFWPAAIYRILLSKNLIQKKPWKHKFASTSCQQTLLWEWLVEFQSLTQFRKLNNTVTYLKNTETEFGGNKKLALILSWQRGKQSRLMPQELCTTPPWEVQGLIWHEGSQSGVSEEEQRC